MSDNRVTVDRGALQAAINMLRRDAEQGRHVRGEMADELEGGAAIAAQPAVAPIADANYVDLPGDNARDRIIEKMARAMSVANNGHDSYWRAYLDYATAAHKVVCDDLATRAAPSTTSDAPATAAHAVINKERATEIARKWMKEGSEPAPEFYWGDFYDCVSEIIANGATAAHAGAMTDETLPFESALAELIGKIDSELDSGDVLKDARRASAVLDVILKKGDLIANAHDFFRDNATGRYETSVDFRVGWNACLDAIANARSAAPTPVADSGAANVRAPMPVTHATKAKWVAIVRVQNSGYSMELSKYIAYALPEGLHELYAAAKPVSVGEQQVARGLCDALSVLRELVELKDLKRDIEGYVAGSTDELAEMADEYSRRKPLAWSTARAVLADAGITRMTQAEIDLFRATVDEFEDYSETSTDYKTLVKWVNRGLLECEHFTVTQAGKDVLAGINRAATTNTGADQ